MLKQLLLAIIIFTAGIGLGWILHGDGDGPAETKTASRPQTNTKVPDAQMRIETLYEYGRFREILELSKGDTKLILALAGNSSSSSSSRSRSKQLLQLAIDTYGDSLDLLIRLARIEKEGGEFEAALALVSRADLLAVTFTNQQIVSQLLNEITDDYAKVLLATENFQAIDNLYERITYAMPEQSQYYLKLGQLRIRLGNHAHALAPLSQIENHMEFGAQARDLIAQTEINEVVTSLEIVPLKGHGNQFVVEATINGRTTVNLLVDTGAAMTIIDQSVLRSMGYSLNGGNPVLFSTANGVVEAPVVSIEQLSLGGASVGPLSIGALPLSMKNGVDGLLGMNFLKRYDFRIDQDRRELHLNSER